jgi:adenylate kinase
MKVIFIGGVHGVGKSTACSQAADVFSCLHVRASDVIRQERSNAIATNGKLVEDADGNQELLLRGFDKIKSSSTAQCILLDGHYALRDSSRSIQLLPFTVFQKLRLSRLICLENDPSVIVKRIEARDRSSISIEEVSELQEAELEHAKAVSKILSLPLSILRENELKNLLQSIVCQ